MNNQLIQAERINDLILKTNRILMDENKDLEIKLSESTNTIKLDNNIIRTLEKEIKKMQDENERLKNKIKTLTPLDEESIKKQQDEAFKLQTEYKINVQHITDNIHKENKELKQELKELNIINKDIIDDNETLIKDNEELRKEIDFITSSCAPEDIVDDLNKEINELKNDNNLLKENLEIKDKIIESYKKERLELIQTINRLQYDVKAYVKILENMSKEFFQKNNELKNILEENNKSLKICNEAIAKYLGKE